ncbi:MAG TPA: hypothetical protein PKE30_17550 [Niabella sp.]|nr:hypothetical protein [Niabella sp.]
MLTNKYKTKLSNTHCLGMISIIEHLVSGTKNAAPEQLLHLAALAEVMQRIKVKLINYSKVYKITFTPAQALAIHALFVEYISPHNKTTGDLYNRIMQMSNEIHQLYQ